MAKFKTRARAVDMLGRQQIAGASTAISELFKNAHDAYADIAVADYFRSDNLLVIRDDGFGMTREEFENRWLVIGTESKLASSKPSSNPYIPAGRLKRAVMGEKGIGRLAIGLLGPQVLILTRALREERSHDLVACFIHWGLFELPGINLDDIEIPIQEIPHGKLPSLTDIRSLTKKWKGLVKGFKSDVDPDQIDPILRDLDDFQVDPKNLDSVLNGPSLTGQSSGTHFYIAPTNESIVAEIESDRLKDSRDFSKFLLGFCNSTFVDKSAPPLKTAFNYWSSDLECEDLIGEGEFFTQDELNASDHQIRGDIDGYGQFKGNVRVYEESFPNHVISWTGGEGKPTVCGPFSIEFGFVQGAQRESRLVPEDWARLVHKLDNIGGLYVYRDRIRILPYGNSDVDWVDIETRRNKGQGYYFFAYRRIFGAVCLSREANEALHEKAGREGFQQGKAYRQLKGILENLFIQLAADFFRDDKTESNFFQLRKKELEKLELARRKREKQVGTKRKLLSTSIDTFFKKANEHLPELEIAELRKKVNHRMEAAAKMTDPDEASVALLDAEQEANRRLAEIRESYHLSKPRGVGLSKPLQRDWDAYVVEQERLEKEVFSPFSSEVFETLGKVAQEARVYVDQRRRLQNLISQVADQSRKTIKAEAGRLSQTAADTEKAAVKTAREAIQDLQDTIAGVEAEFAYQDFSILDQSAIETLRRGFEMKIEEVSTRNAEILGKMRDMLATIAENSTHASDLTQLDMVEAMDEELEGLREQTDADAELVQLGLAVAVINHEFEAAIQGVRRAIRGLKSWANANEELAPLYQDIRTNFDHLDGHLNLFTPLQRRLYRNPIPIRGSDIYHYLKTLFSVRFKRHRVALNATDDFLSSEICGFPSTVYPVFVNIVDNAIFWMKDVKEDRTISLRAESSSFVIENNGPPISRKDRESIFERGFSRKPRGRGLGLYISRKALRSEGMDISLSYENDDGKVHFVIQWPDAKHDESNS